MNLVPKQFKEQSTKQPKGNKSLHLFLVLQSSSNSLLAFPYKFQGLSFHQFTVSPFSTSCSFLLSRMYDVSVCIQCRAQICWYLRRSRSFRQDVFKSIGQSINLVDINDLDVVYLHFSKTQTVFTWVYRQGDDWQIGISMNRRDFYKEVDRHCR